MMTLAALLPTTTLTAAQAGINITDLTLDSRNVHAGMAFVALPGLVRDGRDFIATALDNGASCVLAEADGLSPDTVDERVIAIAGLAAALGTIAARFYGTREADMLLAGVTGTNGKTSVAWFLQQALTAVNRPCALLGTLGARFAGEVEATGHTTPDILTLHHTLATFRAAGAAACVMEVSSHALAQGRVDGVPISLAIFTNLSRDHLDYHGTMDAYFAAKSRLFLRPEVSVAVINVDDEAGQRLLDLLPPAVTPIRVGSDATADVRLQTFTAGRQGMVISVDVAARELQVALPLFGAFNVSNVLAVVASLHGLGYCLDDIAKALAALSPVPGRMQQVTRQTAANDPVVLVDYAHTPDGLEKALQAARQHFDGKLWCVVGCGGNRDKGKRPMMAAIAEHLADVVMLTSDNPRDEQPDAILDDMLAGVSRPEQVLRQSDRVQAITQVVTSAASSDLILICGKGHETWQEIAGRKIPMDDRYLAQEALMQRADHLTSGGAQCV